MKKISSQLTESSCTLISKAKSMFHGYIFLKVLTILHYIYKTETGLLNLTVPNPTYDHLGKQ